MTYEEIISSVAHSTGLSKHRTDKIYKAYWRAVREHIKALPLKEGLTEEQFKKVKPNVNIPSIGKLYVTFENYKRLREHYLESLN